MNEPHFTCIYHINYYQIPLFCTEYNLCGIIQKADYVINKLQLLIAILHIDFVTYRIEWPIPSPRSAIQRSTKSSKLHELTSSENFSSF